MTRTRLTDQQKQENISRSQFQELISKLGWTISRPENDLGEDFQIHVYDKLGQATGVVFHVQLKSVTNLSSRIRKDNLPYSFMTKDLIHWEPFPTPVLLVIWDVILNEGKWIFADSAITALNKENKKWRVQKTVTVKIPTKNDTSERGLEEIRKGVGRRFKPAILSKPAIISVTLPNTTKPTGIASHERFQRFIEHGDNFRLEGRMIDRLEFSAPFGQWFGDYDPEKVVIEIGQQPTTKFNATIIINTGNGDSAKQDIQLAILKSGTQSVTVGTLDESVGLSMTLTVFADLAVNPKITLKYADKLDACTEMRVLIFLQRIREGGKLTIIGIKDIELNLFVPESSSETDGAAERRDLLGKLCSIQISTGVVVRLPVDGIPASDVETIDHLASILQNGKTSRKVERLSIEILRSTVASLVPKLDSSGTIFLRYEENVDHRISLFGNDFNVGKKNDKIKGRLAQTLEELANDSENGDPNGYMTLELVNVEVESIFPRYQLRN